MRIIEQPHTLKTIRPPAVAGAFYPADPTRLRKEISRFLRDAKSVDVVPRALIAPHAGYQYSGPIAASGYKLLSAAKERLSRVILIGPSHRVPFYGLAATSSDAFATPLGTIPIDIEKVARALTLRQVQVLDEAHRQEHSLEVQLPFLQMTLDQFALVPLVVGQSSADEVADVIDALWNDEQTLLIISSDLSHYHDYRTAQTIDFATSDLIEECRWEQLDGNRACGFRGIQGLLKVVLDRGLSVRAIDLRNSGDTSVDRTQVVGYGSYVVF